MTKERYNEIISRLGDKDEYDVDILACELKQLDLNVTTEEAFIICASWLDIECLQTFEYNRQNFFTEDHARLLNNSFELKHNLI